MSAAAPGGSPEPPAQLAQLAEAIATAAARLSGEVPAGIALERSRRAEFGDYSTNAAMLLARPLRRSPREVAEQLGRELSERLQGSLERYEVAGPGFLNLFLADGWLLDALAGVLSAGEGYGSGGASTPRRLIVEFVSANPTGPMHVGHARNAAYGDALARILAFHGHSVWREFYVNDAGTQVRKLGESILALARDRPLPEDGYRGDYVAALTPLAQGSEEPGEVGRAAVAAMVEQMQRALSRFHVAEFDRWAYESSLHSGRPSPVEHTLELLEQQGRTYRSEGALWLRTSEFGDDKDRVLVRSSGEHTYFASDIAYHQDKRERGFERQLDVWGADHHGYIQRMHAAYAALGGDPTELELLIMQLVHLVSSGERAQMSKRAGEFVTLEQLLDDIGADAARWFLLSRSHETTLDLDLDLARSQSRENPVYYVQYAHARIASMRARLGERALAAAAELSGEGPGSDLHPSERLLIHQLLAFPGELAEAAERRAPHRLVAYALALAQDFTAFYRDCRVIGAGTPGLEAFRVTLSGAVMGVLARCLDLLGVSAPEQM